MSGLVNKSNKAKSFAERIHHHQFDKAGQPYINHLAFVAGLLANENDDVITTAWLHDSVEDTEVSLNDISEIFGSVIADSVNAITKRQGESYRDYLSRVKSNDIARKVKIADLTHNMDLSRLTEVTEKDISRRKKYQQAKQFLLT